MKNILLNKKWLGLIALFILVLSLSSCSAFGYWWGEVEKYDFNGYGYSYSTMEIESPLIAMIYSIIGVIDFYCGDPFKCNFFSFIVGAMWIIAIPSVFFYFMGRTDDYSAAKEYKIEIDGNCHTIKDYSEVHSIGGGSVERGNSWSDRIICFIFCALIYYVVYNWITGWFDDLNMLFKLIIGGGIIAVLYSLREILLPISSLVKYASWVFCSIDFVLGILVTLWIN